MNTFARLLSLAAILFTLQGCEVDVKDGKIPPEYMDQARAYAGTYAGEMDRRPGTILLSLRDDGFVEVATPGFAGGDILDEGCGSKIGPLLAISGKQPKDKSQPMKLERLTFAFHRTNFWCIAQNRFYVDFNPDGRSFEASMPLFQDSHGVTYYIYGHFEKISAFSRLP